MGKSIRTSFIASLFVISMMSMVLLVSTSAQAVISTAGASERIEVVIIHSYHADYPWTKAQHEAFTATLRSKLPDHSLDFSVEYLNTKRVAATPEYFYRFAQFLNHKHKSDIPQLIYVTDDYALRQILHFPENLLDNSPVIFSGVNDLSLIGQLDSERYTGVFEIKEIEQNIELLSKMAPDNRKIIFVGDEGGTSQVINRQIREVMQQHPGLASIFITGSSLSQISAQLNDHKDGIVLLTTIGSVIDEEGYAANLDAILRRVVASGHLVMTMEDIYLKHGVVGGYVTSGLRQGEAAAQLAEQVLRGKPLRQIEPVTSGVNEYLFDAQALEQAGVELDFTRYENPRVINPRPSLIEHYHEEFDLLLRIAGLILVMMIIGFTVITLRKNRKIERFAREAINSSALAKEYKHAFDITNIVSTTDLAGRITYINDAFVECFGYSREEVMGKTHAIVRDAETDQEFYNDLWDTILSGNIWRGVIKNRNKDGEKVYLDAIIIPIKSDSGVIQEFISTRTDITKRIQAEEAMIEARDLAEAAVEAKSRFLANMSHEIRTPMNAIIGMGHLALQTELTDKQRNYINKSNKAAKLLLGIINQILDFSKIEAGKMEIEAIPFTLDELFNNLLNIVGNNSEDKRIEFLFDTSRDIPYELIGDSLRLGQILINLLNNAIKFTADGEIIVRSRLVSKSDREVILKFSVQDCGIGMSPDEVEGVFESFSQADSSTTRKYGGSGLGLAICKELVEIMGGEISVSSTPGVGSTFTFTVRLAYDATYQRSVITIPDIEGSRVLIVDDSQVAREIMQKMCTTLKFKSEVASSGEEALAMIERALNEGDGYQLLLVDWMMPSMDGVETLRRIDRLYGSSRRPITIMVTAYNLELLIKASIDMTPDGYLVKPVTPSMLVDKIMAVMGREQKEKTALEDQNGELLADRFKSLQGRRVLLVEDNPVNQEMGRDLLQLAGMIVDIAHNGKEGVDSVKQGGYAAVLMDIQMPVMDGYEATQIIRDDERFKELPIIALTANAMEGDTERSLAAGINAHITKPIDPEELYSVLEQWLAPVASGGGRGATQTREPSKISEKWTLQREEVPEMAGIDIDLAIDRVGGRVGFYNKLLGIFLDTHTDDPERLQELMADKQYEGAIRLAHTIKSCAGNIGATTLQQRALNLEMSLGDDPEEALKHQLKPLVDELERVIPMIRKTFCGLENRCEIAGQHDRDENISL